MNNVFFAMVAFAFVGAVTPGPVNLLATSTALNHGRRAAASHVVGASLAYAVIVYCSGSMMQTLLRQLPGLETTMQISGSVFLLYLAYKIYAAPVASIRLSHLTKSGLWIGSLTQLLNPKAWIVAMSGVSLYVAGQENEHWSLMVFTSVSLIVCLMSIGLWAALGRGLAKYLENSTQQRQFNQVMAGLLGASVIMIWL
ncbi:LysE family translocator [Photobacterium atrarenae]|uniref:LysE family translocator n=1 Tax=Photobacterium atrarenae TaxID=865757 RepID=A0ABY5GIS3_9GAMM|nr:LysE family translocator [Photobacterium atrarenae]UTV28833.1 LysE family translocator [Photobacterium atrarenae]